MVHTPVVRLVLLSLHVVWLLNKFEQVYGQGYFFINKEQLVLLRSDFAMANASPQPTVGFLVVLVGIEPT
jgi:hypothetical protein